MKISTRLLLAVYVPIILAIVIVIALIFSHRAMDQNLQNGSIVRQVRSSLIELNQAVYTYVFNHEASQKQRFLNEYQRTTNLVTSVHLSNSTQQHLLNEIGQDIKNINELFLKLAANYESLGLAGSNVSIEENVELLVGQLLNSSFNADAHASELRKLVDDEASTAERATLIVIIFVLVLATVPLTIVLVRMRKNIITSLSAIRYGASIVGSGNFNFKLSESTNDEIGDLSRDFNRMTSQLKVLSSSVEAERKRFNDVLETLPCYLILLTPDYHVPFANRFFRERFGESCGRKCFDYLFNRSEPCEICETYQALKLMKPVEWEWIGPDKHNYYIYDFPFTDVDGSTLIMEVGIDITEQKKAQKALLEARDMLEERVQERTKELRETRDYLDNLFNHANAPIIVWNSDLKITRFNRAFERLTGRSHSDMKNENISTLFPPDNLKNTLDLIQCTLSGEKWEAVEIPILHKDGSVHVLLWNFANLYADDSKNLIATIAQGQDITERKKADQLKDEFLGMVSHEMKTPLTVIIGGLRTILNYWKKLSEPEKLVLLDDAIAEADQLSHILQNLLELSRIQANRLILTNQSVNIKTMALKVIANLKNVTKQQFVLGFPDDPISVRADPLRLEHILYNLVENAVKYSPDDSVIRIFAKREDNGFVTFSVSNKGKGISQQDQEKLFQPFERLDGSRHISGTGLGLVVCKRLAEAHGGKIWVKSHQGEETTFFFTIPVE